MGQLQFLNGRRYSHSSLEISILRPNIGGNDLGAPQATELFIDLDSIDYGDHLDIALVRGTNRGPIGYTAGDYEADDCNISMGKSTFQQGLVEFIGDGWMGVDIAITVSYSSPGEPLIVDKIVGILAGVADSSKVGPDPNKTTLKIVVGYISRNDVMPLLNMVT